MNREKLGGLLALAFALAALALVIINPASTTKTVTTTTTVPVPAPTLSSSAGAPAQRTVGAAHLCDPANWVMQCSLQRPAAKLSAPLAGQAPVAQGVDFGWGGPSTSSLRLNAKTFTVSYYSGDVTKNWQPAQARAYRLAGVSTLGVFESSQFRPLTGCAGAQADAATAKREAAASGMAGAPVFAAVDFDTSQNPAQIRPYFSCWHAAMGSAAGAYGGLATIRYLFNQGLIRWGWQAYAWSSGCGGTCWDPRAQVQQYLNDVFIGGVGTDLDRAMVKDYGQTPRPAAADPFRILDRGRRVFHTGHGVVVASEFGAMSAARRLGCHGKPRRPACVAARTDLRLLSGRLWTVAHRKDPHWAHGRGARERIMLRQLARMR